MDFFFFWFLSDSSVPHGVFLLLRGQIGGSVIVHKLLPSPRGAFIMSGCVFQVNGRNIEGMRHADVVAFIKKGGDETWLLVVDPESDAHFKKRGVIPTVGHITGTTWLLPDVKTQLLF